MFFIVFLEISPMNKNTANIIIEESNSSKTN